MKKFFASLLLSAAIITSPAQAREALWSTPGNWRVTGWTEGHCLAQTMFDDRLVLGFGLNSVGMFQIAVTPPHGFRGDPITTFATGSLSATVIGTLTGGTAIYHFEKKAIVSMAYAKTLHISGVGSYGMTGSAKALSDLIDCWAAMNGKDA